MPADLQKVRELFLHAVGKLPPDEWDSYIGQACGGDAEVKQEVGHLLQVHREAGSFLDQPAAAGGATGAFPPVTGGEESAADPLSEGAGTVIGPYKLLQQLGEGGMGTVFLAEQTQPVQRKVALKLIKSGMDSRQVIARFEAEQQALALMDHPNIAKVLDAGTTESGRPYFVMELVKGTPITRYCDEHHLTPRQRLELFVPVCQAVQHAHQKGIIHRDLKPSNVMVCLYDGKPVPKVIDFGVAKATGQKLTELTMFTEVGQVVGTLEYMSPEQAELNQLDIDTRSDIYSLGVLLYELLTGTTPLERKRFQAVAFLEVLRLIREEESQKPSTRLSTAEGLPSIAANRGLEPKKLSGLMRGELDWIVMKTLEKDRNRRYETPNGLAQDIERYLNDEAVQACPPSAGYRFRKFARRNKGALAVAALVLFFIALLGGGGGWVMHDRQARQVAVEHEANLALAEADRLQGEGKDADALSAAKRAEGLLAPGGSDQLRRQARRLRADLEMVAQLADIRLQSAAGKDDNFDTASKDPAYGQAFREYGLDLARGVRDPEAAQRIRATSIALELAAALDDWALVCPSTRPKADTSWKDLLAIARAADPDPFRNKLRDAWEEGDVKALEHLAASEKAADLPAASVAFLGNALRGTGAVPAAVDLLRRAQFRHPADFWINHNLASALAGMQPPQLDEAIGYYRAALALRPESPGVHTNLGIAFYAKGRLDEAIVEYQEAIRLKKDDAEAHDSLGAAFYAEGRLDDAIAEFQEAIRLKKDYAFAHNNLGFAWQAKGRLDEAIVEYQEAIRLKKDYADALINLGRALSQKGKPAEAIAVREQVICLVPDMPAYRDALARSHHDLATLLRRNRQFSEGAKEYRGAIAGWEKLAAEVPSQPLYRVHAAVTYGYDLAAVLAEGGQAREAEAATRQAVVLFEKLAAEFPKDGHEGRLMDCRFKLAGLLAAGGRSQEAEQAYSKIIERAPEHTLTLNNLAWLLATCPDAKVRDPRRALELAKKAVALAPQEGAYQKTLGVVHYSAGDWKAAYVALEQSMELGKGRKDRDAFDFLFLAMAHGQLGHKDEALKWHAKAVEWVQKNEETLKKDKVHDDELRRFRAEAEELLKIEKKKD